MCYFRFTIVAVALLILAVPYLALIAFRENLLFSMLLVRLTSPGAALYTQTRLGRNGRHFTIVKLRTMRQDCEKNSGACWSKPGDPRITKLGVWLRKLHIDELPQLWNVLQGDMSLVGPRPERPEIASTIERHVPGYRDRLRVRPGLTGLAQIQLPADTDIESVRRKVKLDQIYIQTRTAWLDVRLLIGTLFYLLRIRPQLSRKWLGLPPRA